MNHLRKFVLRFWSLAICLSVVCLLSQSIAAPQLSIIGDDGNIANTDTNNLQQWVGQRLVFFDILRSDYRLEYSNFKVVKPPKTKRNDKVEDKAGHPIYDMFAGKTVAITSVQPI